MNGGYGIETVASASSSGVVISAVPSWATAIVIAVALAAIVSIGVVLAFQLDISLEFFLLTPLFWALVALVAVLVLFGVRSGVSSSNVSAVESHYGVSDIKFTDARPGTTSTSLVVVPVNGQLMTMPMTTTEGEDSGGSDKVVAGVQSDVPVSFMASGNRVQGRLVVSGDVATLRVPATDGRGGTVEYSDAH